MAQRGVRGAVGSLLASCGLVGPLAAALLAAAPLAPPGPPDPPDPPNILVIVADDLGLDRVACYGAHPDPGNTPVIDQLAADGVLFRNAYSDPLCSPTRANMLTGRYGFRTGLTDALNYASDDDSLDLHETLIPEALPPAYSSAAIGKWHLSTATSGGPAHPLLQGFHHHAGTLENIRPPETYFDFTKSVDGVPEGCTEYATTESVDDALAFIGGTTGPWFVWLAFNAPHSPFHAPPAELYPDPLPPLSVPTSHLYHKAATQAMDTEIGRLLARLGPAVLAQTVIVFVGDNGTTPEAVTAPYVPSHAKGSVYEGGIHVPLIVKGPGVAAGAECNALVNTTDLFATVLELAGGDASTGVDSLSLVPFLSQPGRPSARTHVHAALAYPHGYYPGSRDLRTVRERRFKLMSRHIEQFGIDTLEMYDAVLDPFELVDLLQAPLSPAAAQALATLQPLLESLASPWSLHGGGIDGPFGKLSLLGTGSLLGDEELTLELRRAPANAPALLAFSAQALMLPLYGGLLVPDVFGAPSGLTAMSTDAQGRIQIVADWPAGLPAGLEMWLQFWVVNTASSVGWAASHGLSALTP